MKWEAEPKGKKGARGMEQVLVVKEETLRRYLPQEEFITQGISEILAFILENHEFAPRDQAEYDKSLKQMIPYVVISREGQYFLLRRLKKQTEARLHERLSLGIGGHINPGEGGEGSVLEQGMRRELSEEVYVEGIAALRCVGVLQDFSGGVNDFHTGIVYLLEARGEVKVLETEKMAGEWVSLSRLEEVFEDLETWSQIVLRRLIHGL